MERLRWEDRIMIKRRELCHRDEVNEIEEVEDTSRIHPN